MHNKIIRTGEINNGRPFSTGTKFGIATKKYVYSLFILLAALLITTNAKASKDPDVVQQLSGDVLSAAWPYPIINGAVCNVEDINYYDLNIRSRITDISKDKYKNTIALIIREEPKTSINNPAKYIPNNFTYSVTINITWYDLNENAHTENNVTLTVSYTKEAGAKYDARQYYYLNDARKVEVTVVNAPAPANGAWDPRKVLIIENRLIAYRDYNFDKQLPPGINSKTNLTDELKIDWYFPVDKGATHFDIEWAWIDIESIENYKSDDNGTLRLDPDLIFKRNSTRVTVQNNNYNIPLLYDGAGYLYYRIRPMQYREDGGILEGSWSVSTREGAEAADNYYSFTGHELNQFNWQASTTFAEEGKRKTVIQYFDGTLRSRQTVTKDNSTPDKNTVVAETLYDYQGRPSINILPAPTLSTVIGYARNFNRFIGQAAAQHPKDMYDVLAEGQTVCSSVPVALATTETVLAFRLLVVKFILKTAIIPTR